MQEQEADIFAYELLAPSCVVCQCRAASALELRYMGIGSRAEFSSRVLFFCRFYPSRGAGDTLFGAKKVAQPVSAIYPGILEGKKGKRHSV